MKVYLHIYIKNSIALMNRNVESLHEGKKLLSKKGNEYAFCICTWRKEAIYTAYYFIYYPRYILHVFFQRLSLLKVHLHKYKKTLYSLDKDAWSRFWLCFLWHIFFLINHTKRSAIGLRKLQSLLRNKLSDYCLKKPELIYQSRMKGSICYCSVQSTTGLACC